MATIKVYTGYRPGVHEYRRFTIVDSLPKDEYCGDKITAIEEVGIDCEQGNDEVYDYDYYRLTTEDEYGDRGHDYIAIKKEGE